MNITSTVLNCEVSQVSVICDLKFTLQQIEGGKTKINFYLLSSDQNTHYVQIKNNLRILKELYIRNSNINIDTDSVNKNNKLLSASIVQKQDRKLTLKSTLHANIIQEEKPLRCLRLKGIYLNYIKDHLWRMIDDNVELRNNHLIDIFYPFYDVVSSQDFNVAYHIVKKACYSFQKLALDVIFFLYKLGIKATTFFPEREIWNLSKSSSELCLKKILMVCKHHNIERGTHYLKYLMDENDKTEKRLRKILNFAAFKGYILEEQATIAIDCFMSLPNYKFISIMRNFRTRYIYLRETSFLFSVLGNLFEVIENNRFSFTKYCYNYHITEDMYKQSKAFIGKVESCQPWPYIEFVVDKPEDISTNLLNAMHVINNLGELLDNFTYVCNFFDRVNWTVRKQIDDALATIKAPNKSRCTQRIIVKLRNINLKLMGTLALTQ